MLEIQRYLAKKTLNQLKEEFKIKIRPHKKHPNLISLSYDQIKSPLHRTICQECRGLVIDTNNNNAVVSRGFNKFFNLGESSAAELNPDTTRYYTKLDGTCCILYHYANEWHISTTGSPDGSGFCELANSTFSELFFRTFNELGYLYPTSIEYCYFFELMTPFN